MKPYVVTKSMLLIEALAQIYPDSSKNTLRSLVDEGRVSVNRQKVKKANIELDPDSVVEVGVAYKAAPLGLTVLYEDRHLIVVNKPAGLLSVSTAFEEGDTVHAALKERYAPNKVYVVHRLDRETSGVMMFARSELVYQGLKEMRDKRELSREYRCVAEGLLEANEGTWTSYLIEGSDYIVRPTTDTVKGELAITHFKVLERKKGKTYLAIKLETGRKNQIRAHMQEAGHPIFGDDRYGGEYKAPRLYLHAHRLSFVHPVTKKQMTFEAPLPTGF